MINIEQVSEKLNKILNGTDVENTEVVFPANKNYFFNVATAGIELKEIFDMESGKNFIPVFVSAIGGTFNPIPNLKEYESNYQVEVFFPVRLKEDFYGDFTDFLADYLVARFLTFGKNQRALVNVGVPQYGEIQSFEVKQFSDFIATTYKMPFHISEQWMSMTFTLFIKGSSNSNYILANDIGFKLFYKNVEIENLIIQGGTLGYQSSPQSEQILGTKEVKSIATTSATAHSLTVIVEKQNAPLQSLIEDMLIGNFQNNDLRLGIKMFDEYIYLDTFASSAAIPVILGNTIQMTITFNKKVANYGS